MITELRCGELAPVFTINDLDGHPHSPVDYRGKVTVLYFWSAECEWCQRVDGPLMKILNARKDPIALLPVCSNREEEPSLLKKESQARNLPFILHDAEQRVARLYAVNTTPHFFVLGLDGRLRYQGAFDDVTFKQKQPSRNYLADAIERLAAGQRPDPQRTDPYGCALSIYDWEYQQG
jgi:peroxiredoxin